MHGTVVRSEKLTPHLVRIVLGGDGLGAFEPDESSDAYVNLAFPPAGAPYDPPFDPVRVKAAHPPEHWPVRRRYTVRRWHADAGELTIDFVVHGDAGVAGPWADAARPGDVVVLEGPGGSYWPDPTADAHLMVGDESALPAIAASLEAVTSGSPVIVLLVCDGPADELALEYSGPLNLTWLHRRGQPADVDLLADAVRALDWPDGRVQAFVHGEAGEVRAVRRHLLAEGRVARGDLSASGYWRRDMTDEAWRKVKADFVEQMERDVP